MNIADTQRATQDWTTVEPHRKFPRGVMSEPSPDRQRQDASQVDALAIVAHDLRGPLASLSALMELIDTHGGRGDAPRVAACTQRASDIIDSLDDLLNSILDRVKKTGDPLGFRPTIVDINSVLEKAVALNQPVADKRSIELNFRVAAPITLWGDDRLLLQATENLINNAVKHTNAGGVVTCEAAVHDQHVVIRISDQGAGLSELDLMRAFRPFTKLSSKSAANARSWGLGLWIVRLIIARHGGAISAKAAWPGGGTELTLRLPQ